MQRRVEAATGEIADFVDQDEPRILVVNAGDDDLLYVVKILEGLDRSNETDIFLSFVHEFTSLPAWVDELVVRLGQMVEGGNSLKQQRRAELDGTRPDPERFFDLEPWPDLPMQARDARLDPWVRMRAVIEYVDSIAPPAEGGHRIVWGLLPLHVADVAGYEGLAVRLIVSIMEDLPACCERHRFLVRDDRLAPSLVPKLDAHATPGVAIIDIDFSPERLNEDLNKQVADPSIADEQRVIGLYQLAATDFAQQRYELASDKYAAVYDYYEGKNQPGMQGLCLAGVGDIALRQGDPALALQRYQQALALVCPEQKLPLMLNPMLGAGEASYQCGRFDDAAGYFAHVVAIARAMRNPHLIADARAKQGVALRDAGRHAEAIEAWRSGMTMAETVQDPAGRKANLEPMAALYEQFGMTAEAAIVRDRLAQPMPDPNTEVANAHLIPGHPAHRGAEP
jgi:hypothetical protein